MSSLPAENSKKEEINTAKETPSEISVALSITGLLFAAEATIISTILPTIVHNLDVGSNYAWIANSYFLTSVVILIIGSAICGWVTNGAMLIAGWTIQGIGSGGITMLVDLIICDLIPLRERSKFMGIIMGAITIGTTVGPILGGIIVQGNSWRWVFWLNLPCRRRHPDLSRPLPPSPLQKRIDLHRKFETNRLAEKPHSHPLSNHHLHCLDRRRNQSALVILASPYSPHPRTRGSRSLSTLLVLFVVHGTYRPFPPIQKPHKPGNNCGWFGNDWLLQGGKAYEYASRELIYGFGGQAREQIIGVYTDALKTVWQVGIAIAGLGFVLVLIEKEIKMRKELKSEYGLKKVKEKVADATPPSAA
ncbi:MFS general substrate transporter [Acephala macrosclerotiorum]|nr:MFS general substrate transporter [Acephala macrosclerotiorum]